MNAAPAGSGHVTLPEADRRHARARDAWGLGAACGKRRERGFASAPVADRVAQPQALAERLRA